MSDTLERRGRRQASPAPTPLPPPEPPKEMTTAALTGAAAVADARNHQYRWIILAGLILAAAMEVLDSTIINVALPQMAGNLSTTTQEIAWVSTGYILSNVVVLPMTAFLNTLFGRRNYLVGSIVLFTVASFFCGTSHGLGELVLWRVLQGAGGAALISTAQATLVQVFSPKEQAIVQPLFLLGLVVFPTIGPALGGWITDAISWNWCFFINVPMGLLAGGLVFFLLHDTEPAKPDVPIDWGGIGLLATGLASLQYVLEEGEQDDWFSSQTILRSGPAFGGVFDGIGVLGAFAPKQGSGRGIARSEKPLTCRRASRCLSPWALGCTGSTTCIRCWPSSFKGCRRCRAVRLCCLADLPACSASRSARSLAPTQRQR